MNAAYEICLKGWQGGTSDTDHLVKWIKIKNSFGKVKDKEIIETVFEGLGLEIQQFGDLGFDEDEIFDLIINASLLEK